MLSKSNGFIVGNYKDDVLSGFGMWFYFNNEIPSSLDNVKEVFCGEFINGKPYYGVFYCNNEHNDNVLSLSVSSTSFVRESNHYIYVGKLDSNGKKNDVNGFVYDYNTNCVVYGYFMEDKIKECYQLVLDKKKNYEVTNVVFMSFCEDYENIKELWHSQAVIIDRKDVLEKVKAYVMNVLIEKFIKGSVIEGLLNNTIGNSFYEIIRMENKFIGNYETDLKQFYNEIYNLMKFEPFVI